jgi:hypothetical protein
MNKYHIYIPSKRRASNCVTAKILQQDNLDFTIMVEPQDYNDYRKFFDVKHLFQIDLNDQGIAYVRNQALALSIDRNESCHWQMDDDIRKFMIRKDNKNVKTTPSESVAALETAFDSYRGLGMIAHRYTSFAFAQKTEFGINQNPCSSFLLRNDLGATWHKGTVVDADYALQVLTSGWSTIIANLHLIDTIPPMKQSGGLTDSEYAGDGRFNRFTKLSEDWSGCFNVKRDKNGKAKLYHKRIWSSFKQRPIKIENNSLLNSSNHSSIEHLL